MITALVLAYLVSIPLPLFVSTALRDINGWKMVLNEEGIKEILDKTPVSEKQVISQMTGLGWWLLTAAFTPVLNTVASLAIVAAKLTSAIR